VLLNEDGTGLVQIAQGKSKAARRFLPMLTQVFAVFHKRWTAQGEPTEGWVFPSGSACGHFEGSTAKGFHARALKHDNENLEENEPALQRFEPYVMRHTALTQLGESVATFSPWRGSPGIVQSRSPSVMFTSKPTPSNGLSQS